MAMSPHQLTMLLLEKPQALAQLAAAKGIEPPETPEEAQEKLKDPSLSPQDRERLLGIASGLVQEKQPEFKPLGEAIGEAGGAIAGALGAEGQQNVQSGLDEQSKLRGRGGNALTDALSGTPAPAQPAPQARSGFDPSAPGAPNIPAAQGPTGNAGAAAGAIAGQQLAPLTQQLMQGQPPQVPGQQPAVNINIGQPGQPSAQTIPGGPMAGAAPGVAPMGAMQQPGVAPAAPASWEQALAGGLAGVGAPSTPGGGNQQRDQGAPQVNFGNALQPQTLALIQALAAQQGRTPNLQALLSGGQ